MRDPRGLPRTGCRRRCGAATGRRPPAGSPKSEVSAGTSEPRREALGSLVRLVALVGGRLTRVVAARAEELDRVGDDRRPSSACRRRSCPPTSDQRSRPSTATGRPLLRYWAQCVALGAEDDDVEVVRLLDPLVGLPVLVAVVDRDAKLDDVRTARQRPHARDPASGCRRSTTRLMLAIASCSFRSCLLFECRHPGGGRSCPPSRGSEDPQDRGFELGGAARR